ncbi:inner centromere protein-like [Labrus bergylta]|uniref:inner centromere protein-like n=1 Tax=Labrus bergylta TaxID=56723 RepID=UPI0033141218
MEHYRSQSRAVNTGADDFRYSMQGAETFHQRPHHWPNQYGPHRPSHQRRPPHWQVVADLKNEIQGLKILLKKEQDLNKAGCDRDMLSKNIIEELEERLELEHHKRLECEKEIKMLKEERKHFDPSCAEKESLMQEKEEVISDELLKAEQLEISKSRCLELSDELRAQENTDQVLQKRVEDLQRPEELRAESLQKEVEEARPQHEEGLQNQDKSNMCPELSSDPTAQEEADQMLQEEAEVFQQLCESEEKISTWRKIKKACTPKHRRQFKHQKKQMLDHM